MKQSRQASFVLLSVFFRLTWIRIIDVLDTLSALTALLYSKSNIRITYEFEKKKLDSVRV